MPRTRLAAFVLVLTLLASLGGKVSSGTAPDEQRLQGAWEITSVLKDGEPDPTQVGGSVQFAGGAVEFAPALVAVRDTPSDAQALASAYLS